MDDRSRVEFSADVGEKGLGIFSVFWGQKVLIVV